MRKEFKKFVAGVMVVVMSVLGSNCQVIAATEKVVETVYNDGIEYKVITDVNKGTITIKTADDMNDAELMIYANKSEGTACVYNEENACFENVNLKINTLTEKEVDVVVTDEEDEIVDRITSIDEIVEDSYEPQAAVAVTVVVGITVETLLEVLLGICAAIAVAGVVYYGAKAAVRAIEKTKDDKKAYFKAYIFDKNVFVNIKNKISRAQAISRIRNRDNVYTYTRDQAKDVTVAAGFGVVGPEISCLSGKIVLYHYHRGDRKGAHIFYGVPIVQ